MRTDIGTDVGQLLVYVRYFGRRYIAEVLKVTPHRVTVRFRTRSKEVVIRALPVERRDTGKGYVEKLGSSTLELLCVQRLSMSRVDASRVLTRVSVSDALDVLVARALGVEAFDCRRSR